jgi:hypothetical protein
LDDQFHGPQERRRHGCGTAACASPVTTDVGALAGEGRHSGRGGIM